MKDHELKYIHKEGQAFRRLMTEHGIPTLNRIHIRPHGIEVGIVIAPFFNAQFINDTKLCDYLCRLLQRSVTVGGYGMVRSFWRAPRSVFWVVIESSFIEKPAGTS